MSDTFDPVKFGDCGSPSKDYTVTYPPGTNKVRSDACVVVEKGAEKEATKLLIKNGWSFPMTYRTDATSGVLADARAMDTDFTDFWRNKLATVFPNTAFASGLDVGSFVLTDTAPDSFTVTGRMSWTGTIIDLELSVFMAFLPKSALLSQANLMVDYASCGVSAAQKVDAMYRAADAAKAAEVPSKLAEVLRGCLSTPLLEKYGAAELLNSVAKTPRIVPETIQLATAAFYSGITGKDMAQVTLTVDKAGRQLLSGLWSNDCAGRDDLLKFNEDNSGIMQNREYDARNNFVNYNTLFHVVMEGGEPVVVIDRTDRPNLSKGVKLRAEPLQDGNGILLTNGGKEWAFYKDGIPSPC